MRAQADSPDTGQRDSEVNDFTNRIRTIRDALTKGLVERDVAVRLALLAALTGEHLLLIGPPGTAKSLVARRLRLAFKDAAYFERLLTKFSVPEELFGPLSIKGLEEDRYERLTESYLPAASVAFLDEIFKANSAILNALLTILNERMFDNGTDREKTPLVAVVGASNELPEGEELDALFDRFLLRLHVGPVSKDAFPDLLKLRGDDEPSMSEGLGLTAGDLDAVRKEAAKVDVPDDVTKLLCDLREWCIAEEIRVSDRRWRKVVKLLQTSAWTSGRDAVSVWDCWLLQHCLWRKTDEREKIYDWYASRAGVNAVDLSGLQRIVSAWEGWLFKDKEEQSQMRDSKGKFLFEGKDGKHTSESKGQDHRGKKPLFVLPEDAYQRHYHGRSNELLDPKNGEKGYTEEELGELLPIVKGDDFLIEDEDDLQSYIKDRRNAFMVGLAPAMEPTKHKDVYITDCLRQLKEHRDEVEEHGNGVDKQIASFKNDIRNHLWVPDDFAEPASRNLGEVRADIKKLRDRLSKVMEGYENLPREETHSIGRERS